jgi:stearoyl-CoA desaturase (delta-9 desaturase)
LKTNKIILGWATDLKTVSDEVVKKRVLRTGDGTHRYSVEAKKNNINLDDEHNNNEGERDLDHFWGWVRLKNFVY